MQALGDKILILPSSTYSDVAGAFSTSRTKGIPGPVAFITGDSDEKLRLPRPMPAPDSRWNFGASNSTLTMNLKQLATVATDDTITQEYRDAPAAGVDCYASVAGIPAVLSSGGNDYFDNVLNTISSVSALKVAGFNALAQVASKVPQTEAGISLLKSAYRQVCQQAVNNGFAAPGSWTSPETSGVGGLLREHFRVRVLHLLQAGQPPVGRRPHGTQGTRDSDRGQARRRRSQLERHRFSQRLSSKEKE